MNKYIDVYKLLGKRFNCPYCGGEHYIPTESVVKGKISSIPELLGKMSCGRKVLLLSDDITYEVAGKKIESALEADDWRISSVVLRPRGTKTVHAEEKYFPDVFSASEGKNILLTVGTGSITDMGKYAGEILKIPVACFPTAPSMNAYTSGVAAFIKEGLKVTLPVLPPKAVIIEMDTVSGAPIELMKAGFADSMAKCFANADWRLSSIVTGEHFCSLPLKIVSESEKEYIDKGNRLLDRDMEVVKSLMDGLLRGGFSMVIAGTSSPASGGEHLISHFLDMFACRNKKDVFAYHGIQVGIGVVMSSIVYERLKALSTGQVEKVLGSTNIDYDRTLGRIESDVFGGNVSLKNEFNRKKSVLKKLRQELPCRWEEIKEKVFSVVYSPEQVRKYLKKAGCPLTFKEIGVGSQIAHNAIMFSRYIRSRITILDVADELGILKGAADDFIKG